MENENEQIRLNDQLAKCNDKDVVSNFKLYIAKKNLLILVFFSWLKVNTFSRRPNQPTFSIRIYSYPGIGNYIIR